MSAAAVLRDRRGNGNGGVIMRHGNMTQNQQKQHNKRMKAYLRHRRKLNRTRTQMEYDYQRSVRETRSGGE